MKELIIKAEGEFKTACRVMNSFKGGGINMSKKLKAYIISNGKARDEQGEKLEQEYYEHKVVFHYSWKEARKKFRYLAVSTKDYFDLEVKREPKGDRFCQKDTPYVATYSTHIEMFYTLGWSGGIDNTLCDYCKRCEFKEYPKSKIDYDFSACIECSEEKGFYDY